MVLTNVMDVLPDGTILEIVLSVENVLSINLKRTNLDADFEIRDVQVLLKKEKIILEALTEINRELKSKGVDQLKVSDLTDGFATLCI